MIDRMSLAEETEAGSSEFRDRLLALVEERGPGHPRAAHGVAAPYVPRPETHGGSARDPAGGGRACAAAYVGRLETYGISAEHVAAEVLGAFRFASDRGRGPVAVRAFNPTRERDGYEPLGSVLETNSDDWPFLVDSVSAAL